MSELAYCMKCKEKREMVEPEAVFTANGTPATRGKCAVCGTTLFRMGLTDAHEGLPKPEVTAKPKKKKKAPPSKKKSSTGSTKRSTASSSSSGRRKAGGKLVIVESPAKARTVSNFLGKGFTVIASKGHVRDLLKTQLSVDIENNFEPKYRVPNDKRDTIKQLKQEADRAEEIFLATDPDREGEAIAWHLFQATDMDLDRTKRVVFHEITDKAVAEAFSHPRDINMDLVNAQQARRILDRLVGYNITELLWDRVRNRLSAGRVQSIALRMVVDREREVEAFSPIEYWTLDADLTKRTNDKKPFRARLVKINNEDFEFHSEDDVKPHLDVLERSTYMVESVKRGTRKRRPAAPFTTSTLQQEASRRLGFNAAKTMRVAQQLYEGIEIGGSDGVVGLITYMRTDSTNVAEQAQEEAREYIVKRWNKDYIPETPPQYKTKSKTAQEAHEAIRPTSVYHFPTEIKDNLTRDQFKLYNLIWERFVASQMENAVYNTLRIEIRAGENNASMPYLFRVSGSTIQFMGFLALYEESRDEDASPDEDEGRILPDMSENELLNLLRLMPEQHFTQPPPRYTEATLVRTLEEYGIGRPSTYAATVDVISRRDYVERKDKRLTPTETGKIVNDLLVEYFPEIMNYEFTAHLEDELDDVADGDMEWHGFLGEFYTPFEQQLENARKNMPRIQQEEYVGRECPDCADGQLIIKYGRWGKFIGCTNYPDCTYTEQYLDYTGISCPVCGEEHGGEVVERRSRRGRLFFGCSRYPECEYSAWKLADVRRDAGLPPEEDEAIVQDEAS